MLPNEEILWFKSQATELVNYLEHVPPVELQAVALLQMMNGDTSAGGALPIVSQEMLTSATSELIAYTKSCAALASKLQYLTPIVLSTVECAAWPL